MLAHVDVREISPDDGDGIRTFVEVRNAASAVDCPWQHPETPYRREMKMRHGWDGEVGRHFVADDGGEAVGALIVNTSEWDNHDLAWLALDIHPAHRRRGHGTALLEAAYDVSRAMGRSLIGIDGWEGQSTRGFAAAVGFEEKSRAVNRRQHLDELPEGLVEKVRDEAARAATAYELVRMGRRSPDELLGPLAELAAAINDSPLDDLELEDEVYTAERVRAFEEAQEASGMRLYRVLARHRGTGELAGHTVVTVDSERPTLGNQEDTAVARAHRGHRLGALLKAEMVLWLAETEPQLETIDTWNAESNDHMVGVNELLGYRVMGRELEFQRRI